ncbi:MAG: tetratricopeptide repeat protein [Verrucomicrobiae bacterium]|nr:tetratricopeptide repeat protein [Verrucomicrobiae bacterium]
MKIHLLGSLNRPAITDRTALSAGLFGNYQTSPDIARERYHELEQSRLKAKAANEPADAFLQRFFIPMLEAALSLGDLALARKARELAYENSQFPDEAMPRWHELNLALALAEHESDLANEHAYKLLDLAENAPDQHVRENALRSVNRQANLLANTAHFALAEPLYRKSLQLAERNLGPDHPTVVALLSNLALLLKATNRLVEAEQLVCRALDIDEKSFGPDHPKVAIRLNNLAQLLKATNRLAEAEPHMRRALAIDEKSLGPDHPKVATDLNNLAQLLKDTNRLAEAEPLMRRALAIGEKSLGPDHPDVAIDLNNLALLLHDTGRSVEAETLAERAARIMIRSFGSDHPKTQIALRTYKTILSARNLSKAERKAKLEALS